MVIFNNGLNNQYILNLENFLIFHINTENVKFSVKLGKIYCYGLIDDFESLNNNYLDYENIDSIKISPELFMISFIPYNFHTQNCEIIEIYNYRIYYKIFDELKDIDGSADELAKFIEKNSNFNNFNPNIGLTNDFLRQIVNGQFIL